MAINTIIFGATGGVGSNAVKYVASKGVKVFLALRDTSKPIPGISAEDEKANGFERLQADLTKPDTVLAAAKQAKAQSAFIYYIHGQHVIMKDSIQALKSAGVKSIVFLSSYSVQGDIRKYTEEDYISYVHAQIEIYLEEIYGEGNFTAMRPAWFATNMLRLASQFKTGTVRQMYPENKVDVIPPEDTGAVGGALLLLEAGSLPRYVTICGQQLISEKDMIEMIGKANGQNITVEHLDEETGVKMLMNHIGLSEPIARYLARVQREGAEGSNYLRYKGPDFDDAQKAVKKYTGREPMTVEQWVDQNKALFL